MVKLDAFNLLKEYSKDLKNVSYDNIINLLKHDIKKIPIPLAKVHIGEEIDRIRPNGKTELFTNISDLSYIKDKTIIDQSLTKFGRANLPYQVMFYGALRSTEIDRQRLTAIAETSQALRNNLDCLEGEHHTVSRWLVKSQISVVEMVFSEAALKSNPTIETSLNNQLNFLSTQIEDKNDLDFYRDFLIFISEEFAKVATSEDDYKISAAYTNIVLSHPEVNGIFYPSVQTVYKGFNIALLPVAVDKHLTPTKFLTQILYKKGDKCFITNGLYYCDSFDQHNNLEWKKTPNKLLSDISEVNQKLGI
ncbi:hypothetical protein [Sphingobacterium sp.]|uniref:hypothetical protein n=1 Tax=Sphingobacterium sp. TaxID=341027 RepID=UPI0028AB75B9|nr:hypothetical protein [Sphingobacterium sp.]